jgi:hypothetical protein
VEYGELQWIARLRGRRRTSDHQFRHGDLTGAAAVTEAQHTPGYQPWPAPLVDRVEPVELRTDQPHSARMYDYYLGGKDNFPADREAAEQVLAAFPDARIIAQQNRAFLRRVTRFLVEAGIRQFLDIGTGIPTSPNLHEVAQQFAPETRVVYADNDPIVLTHARALLTSTPEGRTAYLDADARDPERIIGAPELIGTLDLSRPIGLSLFALMQFVPDDADPLGIVARLLDALPTGSYLALSHVSTDLLPPAAASQGVGSYRSRGIPVQPRSRAEIERFFTDLELVEPGLVFVHRWHPDGTAEGVTDAQVNAYGGVARKI